MAQMTYERAPAWRDTLPPTTAFFVGQQVRYDGALRWVYSVTIYTDRYRVEENQQRWHVTYYLSNARPGTVYDPHNRERWIGPIAEDELLFAQD
jgi:hypothetical protein